MTSPHSNWRLDEEAEDFDEDLDRFDDPDDEDEYVLDCGDPDCCMNFGFHFRSECYTPEMLNGAWYETEESPERR